MEDKKWKRLLLVNKVCAIGAMAMVSIASITMVVLMIIMMSKLT